MVQTPLDLLQHHRRGGLFRLPTQRLHIDVHGLRHHLALAHLRPQTQPTLTVLHTVPQHKAQIGLHGRKVEVRKSGVDISIPGLQVAGMASEQWLVKTSLQAKPRTPFRRRRGIDAPIVAAQAIAQNDIDFLQFHRRQRRLLINPAQAPTVHKYFGLAPKPVGQS